jgi:cytochrome P450
VRPGRTALPPRFNARDPATLEDPYPRYAELRRAGPLARAGAGTWLVTRHADVTALLGDRRLGHELELEYHQVALGPGPASEFFHRIVFYRDPPAHTRLRRLMAAAFTPRLVNRMREPIRALVDELLEPGLERGGFDAVDDLAYPLSVAVVCRLIGIPRADWAALKPRAVDLGRGFNAAPSPEERRATDEAVVWLQRYLDALIGERRPAAADDLLSSMLAAEHGGDRLTHDEVVDNCIFLVWAGFETVMSVIGTAFAGLLRFPDQLERLREEPALVPSAVEELLRYDAPIQGTARLVRRDIELGGRRLRAARVLVLMLGSANHDERVFARPERLDVARHPNPHVSFGGGAHRCLGSVLARAEVAIVLEQVLRRCAAIEMAGAPRRRTAASWMRFHASVPVAVTPAAAPPR